MLRAAAPPLVMPAFVPGWDEISYWCRCLHRRALARCLKFLLFTVVCHAIPLVIATLSRVRARVRVRARGRAGPTPLHQCAPQHTRTPIWGQGRTFGPFSPAPFLAAAFRMPAPPRPRRGRVGNARGRQGQGHRYLGRCGHTLSPAEPRTPTREPTVDAVLAATHGVGPGLHHVPRRDALSQPAPNLAVSPTLAMVFTLRVRAASRTPSHMCSHVPALGRVANTAAASASPRPHRRRPHRDGHQVLVLRPSSPATQGGSKWSPCFGQSPMRRGTRRRRGHPVPPSPS
jgi:hypothetical protein